MGHAALREPSNQYTAFTHLPRTCMRGNHARRRRQAIPNRRRPDLGVCVQSLNCVPRFLAARPKGVAADRKVRGSRKRGYRKPVKVSCTPFCKSRTPQRAFPRPRVGPFPASCVPGRSISGTFHALPWKRTFLSTALCKTFGITFRPGTRKRRTGFRCAALLFTYLYGSSGLR